MNKKAIILVFAMFGLPVVVATLMHSQWLEWTPSSTRNHGTLIAPVIEWQASEVLSTDGATISQASLSGQWQLVLHNRSDCGAECLETLYWLRQVRLAQDRHVQEIGLLLVQEKPLSDGQLEEIKALSETYVIVTGEAATLVGSQFPTEPGSSSRYILDPMANIMMSYSEDQSADDIRKDLGRLLTWTQPSRP